jgi:hypothetical protein
MDSLSDYLLIVTGDHMNSGVVTAVSDTRASWRLFFRLIQPALQNVGTISEQLAAAGWLCWTIPLLTTELVLQGRKILRVQA